MNHELRTLVRCVGPNVDTGTTVELKRSCIADDKACQACKDIAAEGWINADDLFLGFSANPPHHPNCRCTEQTTEVTL